MKSNVIISILLLSSYLCSAQEGSICFPDGIEFTAQSQIDSFQINNFSCKGIGGDLKINGNDIIDLSGLSRLTSVQGHLYIQNNNALASLSGLEGITYIGKSLLIWTNHALMNLTGLQNISFLGGGLSIKYNNSLTSLAGLEGLNHVSRNMAIYDNNALTDLTGLQHIKYIGEGLIIRDNNALTSLTGLEGLTTIFRFNIGIINNDALTSLAGLENVNFGYYGGIGISDNNSLTDISAISNISSHKINQIWFSDNLSLSYCHIENICAVLKDPNPGTFIFIFNNAAGCNNQEQVQEACELTAIEALIQFKNCQLSPNPFTNSTTLSYTLDKPNNVHITFYNLQGQIVDRMQERQQKGEQQLQWNAKGLPAGLYIIQFQAGNNIASRKLLLAP